MEYQPLLSVIITNYNHATWVSQRIDTVLQQTYQNLEIILMDDCSTDNSREVLESYRGHPKIKTIVYNNENSGSPFIQWHKGLSFACGELVWIAESDDFSHPELLESLVPAFIKEPELVVAFCEVVFVDKNGIIIIPPVIKKPAFYTGQQFIKEHMVLFDSLVNAGMVVFRRSALERVSDIYTKYKLSGDYRFFCEIILQGKVYSSGLPHAYFRKHEQEMTSRFLGTLVYHSEHIDIVEWLIKLGKASAADIRNIALRECSELYCIGKGMNKLEYLQLIEFFKTACRNHNVRFPHISASYHSYQKKWRHWIGKFRSGMLAGKA